MNYGFKLIINLIQLLQMLLKVKLLLNQDFQNSCEH